MAGSIFDIELTWARDHKGFHFDGIIDANLRELIPDNGERIVRKGGSLQHYKPANIPGLLKRFLAINTPADLLSFVDRWGPLTREGFSCREGEEFPNPDGSQSFYDKDGEELSIGLEYASWFRDVVIAKDKPAQVARSFERFKFETYPTRIVADKKRGIRLIVAPDNLLGFLTLELARIVLNVSSGSFCLKCGEFFLKGVGTDRRGDAQFCSDEHRIEYNSLKRSRSDVKA
jgi:hypothetical protein